MRREDVLKSISNGLFSEEFVKEFPNDKDIVLAVVKYNPHALQFASEQMKNDKDVVLVVLSKFFSASHAIMYIGDEIKKDKEVEELIKKFRITEMAGFIKNFEHLDMHMINNTEFAKQKNGEISQQKNGEISQQKNGEISQQNNGEIANLEKTVLNETAKLNIAEIGEVSKIKIENLKNQIEEVKELRNKVKEKNKGSQILGDVSE